LRGDLEVLRPDGLGVFSPQEEVLYVEESILSKLYRHGTTIERQPNRALHELERRQATRRGAALTPPYIVDVEVSRTPEPVWVPKPD
jgi:hypothetical protein